MPNIDTDDTFTFANSGDQSRRAKLDLSGVPSNSLRIFNVGEKQDKDPWIILSSDFLNSATFADESNEGYRSYEQGGGARSPDTAVGNTNHPGIYNVTSAAVADSGVITRAGAFALGGGESHVCIFRTPGAWVNVSITHGIFDTASTMVDPVSGVYIWHNGAGVFVGKAANSGARTTTATSVTLAIDTFYTSIVKVNRDKTSAVFALYNDAGDLLWRDVVVSNLPTTQTVWIGCKHGTTGVAAIDCGGIDYMRSRIGSMHRPLLRYMGNPDELYT